MPIFYECQRCTACCRWPGQVVLTQAEITALAAFKELSEFDFIQQFKADYAIVGISGSLRAQSFNTMLLHAAAAAMPADSRIEIATIRGIPLYDGDVEARDGVPRAAQALPVAGSSSMPIAGAHMRA